MIEDAKILVCSIRKRGKWLQMADGPADDVIKDDRDSVGAHALKVK
jgi:hypothetical protein